MKLVLFIVVLLCVVVGLGFYIEDGLGPITVTLADWTIYTSAGVLIVANIALFALLYYLLRMIVTLLNLPKRLRLWRHKRRSIAVENAMLQSLTALITGDLKHTERLLAKNEKCEPLPLMYLLISAYAAQQLGANDKRDAYLKQALHTHPNADLVISLVRANLYIDAQQTELALALLHRLEREYPRQQRVSMLLLEQHIKLHDFEKVLELLPKIKHRYLSRKQLRDKQIEAYDGLLHQTATALDDPTTAAELLTHRWRAIPKKLRSDPRLIKNYVTNKLRYDNEEGCEIILQHALKKRWDSELIALYGQVAGQNPITQLKFAERFLSTHANDPVLLLALGRLSINNRLWGKARTYLEQVMAITPSPETCMALANVMRELNEHATVADLYKQGLELASKQHDAG